MALKYKVGDKVRIKSLDWYNENKDEYGNIDINHDFIFYADRSKYCGKVLTISEVFDNCYSVKEDNDEYYWTDEMIEGLAEEDEIEFTEEDKYWCDIMSESDPTTYVLPQGYQFKDENGNVINATKIVLEKKSKKSPKTDDIIKWLREHDMTKYIGVLYSGMCSITFDTEKLIKDITEMIGDK